MKAPYRYLIGIAVGLIAGFFLPVTDTVMTVVSTLAEIVLRMGRYLALPLIFFSLPVAVTRLRREQTLGAVIRRSGLYVLYSSAALTILGTGIGWLISFGRIPVIPGSGVEAEVMTFVDMIRNVFTYNGFSSLVGNPSYLLPLVVPAFILGWHFHHDREIAEPAFNVFDSLSRIIYRINTYLLVLMPGFLAVLTAVAVMQGRQVVDFVRFLPVLGILLGVAVVLIGAVYPLIIRLACKHHSPWKDMMAMSGALLGAFFSGSTLFNYGNLTQHLKENMNVQRKTASLVAPVYLMFARGGTALITSFAMLTIIHSYSSLEITLFQAAWTALFSFLISFALPATPDKGLVAGLVLLGGLYGRGLDDGWLILTPVLPILCMIGALLDSATAAVLILIVNRRTDLEEEGIVSGVNF